MICPKCNMEQGNNKFCDNCGSKLEEKKMIFCSNCGKKQEMANFCTNCGSKLGSFQNNVEVSSSNKTVIDIFFILSIINLVIASVPIIIVTLAIVVLPFALILGADVSGFFDAAAPFLIYSTASIVFFFAMLIVHIKKK